MKKWHLWLAASIGLVVIAGMMIREFDVDALSSIDLSPGFFLGVGMAVGLFALQNLMLSLRFQHLCHRRLSLMQSFRVNVLCEFTSAVTPSAVGGSGLAFVYLNREGVTMGRSIFTMFAALLADEAFLAVSCCLLYFLVPSHLFFSMVDGVGVSADVVNEWIKGGVQMVFIDTPGIHKPHSKLGAFMTDSALNTFKEVDVVLFLVDSDINKGPGDRYILDKLKEIDTPKILVINKIDAMEPEYFRSIYEEYSSMGIFDDVFGTSALEGRNVDKLLARIEDFLEEGPMFFPEDMVTDHPERFIVSEIIREKLLLYLEDEVPHGVAVEIESYSEEPEITRIGAVIYCERKSHKGIIIGKQGKKLKGVGKAARLEIEALLGTKVFLELWVKIKENWRDSDLALSNFGYRDE